MVKMCYSNEGDDKIDVPGKLNPVALKKVQEQVDP